MQRRSVDLPEPDGPMMHTASPFATLIEMPRSTSVAPNAWCTSTSRKIGASSGRKIGASSGCKIGAPSGCRRGSTMID
jgi:hypothetical protein